jgi:hypothetical protein
VVEAGATTVDGDFRAIPQGESAIVLYSATDREAQLRIPAGWARKKLTLTEVEAPDKREVLQPSRGSTSVTVHLRARTPYRLGVARSR